MTAPPANPDPLLAAVQEYQALRRSGVETTIDEFVQQYPEIGAELRELLLTASALDQVKPVENAPGKLGEYRLLREIGRGGMGVVYEAVQESLGRRVAVKVLSRRDDTLIERFQREARIAAQLHHTNIVPVFAVGDRSGMPFYVMQFIDGSSLNQWIAARQHGSTTGDAALSVDFTTVAALGLQAAEALAYAHHQGVLHRDLKPANFLLDSDGTLWIADFGLAKAADDQNLTASGAMLGTLRYMAPERFAGQCDERSDVYSLGVTLYELLTLRPAFDAADQPALVEQVMRGTPPPPRSLSPSIPRDLETVVLKAMAREPKSRYATAAEFATDLRRVQDGQPIAARPPGPIERLSKWARRNPAWATVAGVSAAALITVAIYSIQLRSALSDAKTNLEEAKTQNARAEENLKSLRAAIDEFVNLIENDAKLQALGLIETRTQLFKAAIRFYDLIRLQTPSEETLAGLASALHKLAHVLGRQNEFAQAREVSIREAELWAQLTRDHPENSHYQFVNSGAVHNIGWSLYRENRFAEGEPYIVQAIAISRALLARDPSYPGLRSFLAIQIGLLAGVREEAGDMPAAMALNADAIDVLRPAIAERSDDAYAHNQLAGRLVGTALFTDRSGNPAAAEPFYLESLKHYRRSAVLAPQNAEYSRAAVRAFWAYADHLRRQKRGDDAITAMREAAHYEDAARAGEAPSLESRINAARLYTRFGFLQRDGGRLADGMKWHEQAVALLKNDDLSQVRAATLRDHLDYVFYEYAKALTAANRHAEAAENLARAATFALAAQVPAIQIEQATALARHGDVAAALKLIEAHVKENDIHVTLARPAARALAIVVSRLPADDARRESIASRAVLLLQKAITAKDFRIESVIDDADFIALRSRPDYRKFIDKHQADASKPKPEKK